MPKRKTFDFKWIVGIVAGVSVFSGAIVGLSKYITLPEKAEAIEKRVIDIEKYIDKQQTANEVQQQILNKLVDKEVADDKMVLSPDGKYFYDKKLDKWRPIREIDDGR